MARSKEKSHHPAAAVLTAAALLGAAATGWALWLWRQLLVARAGGEVSCGLGGDGEACAAAWDSPFAAAVHAWTGLPVAAWGVAWGLIALVLPLAALVARRRGRAGAVPWAGAAITGAGGIAGVSVLAAVLALAGEACQGCLLIYGIVVAYAAVVLAVVLVGTGRLPVELSRGATAAAVTLGAAWLVLLVPGLRTPRASVPIPFAAPGQAAPEVGKPLEALADLEHFVSMLPPDAAQQLSDSLFAWSRAEAEPLPAPRSLLGSPMAPVRITDFADILCGHCATLHGVLTELRRVAPPESFSVESRFFPLDGVCNPNITSSRDGLRCTAARALICIADEPRFFELAGRLYESQSGLTEERIYSVLAAVRDREQLARCVASPETDAKLQEDIAWAEAQGITGTPLVLANGRRATAFPPFLIALVLSGGDPEHPAFRDLPPPRGAGS
jgi:hypothetical protein